MAASLIGGGRCFPAMCGCPRDSIFEANEEFCEAWSMPERCHTSELFCASDCRGSYCEGLANQHLFHNCSDAAFNHDFYSLFFDLEKCQELPIMMIGDDPTCAVPLVNKGMDYLFGGLQIDALLFAPVKVVCVLMLLQLGGIPVPRRGSTSATVLWAIWMIILVLQVLMVIVSLAIEIIACAAFIAQLSPCARTARIAKFMRISGDKKTLLSEFLQLTFFFQPCFLSKMISMWIYGDAIMQGFKVAAAAELLRLEQTITSKIFKEDTHVTLRRGDKFSVRYSEALETENIEGRDNDDRAKSKTLNIVDGISDEEFHEIETWLANRLYFFEERVFIDEDATSETEGDEARDRKCCERPKRIKSRQGKLAVVPPRRSSRNIVRPSFFRVNDESGPVTEEKEELLLEEKRKQQRSGGAAKLAKAALEKHLGESVFMSSIYDVRIGVAWLYNLKAWVVPFPTVIFTILWLISLAWIGSFCFLPIALAVYVGGWCVLRLTTELHEISKQRGWKVLSSMTWWAAEVLFASEIFYRSEEVKDNPCGICPFCLPTHTVIAFGFTLKLICFVLFLSPLIVYGWFLTLPWWYGNNLLEVAQREAAPLYAFCFDALKYPLRLPWLTDVDILRFADIDQAFHRVVGHFAGQLNHLNDPTKYMKTADAWMFLAVFMSWLKFLVNALYFLFGVLNMNGEWTNAAVYKDVASQIDHDAVKEGSLKQTEETKKGDASHNQKGMETAFFSPAELREIRILLKERETTSRHRHRGEGDQSSAPQRTASEVHYEVPVSTVAV